MAKVSILIPVYNVEQYLVQCMDSVINQTLNDIEIICLNDGSKDNSLNILKSYAEKDDRIIIIDKENGGYGKGMNIALEHASGEYVGIVEPDDFVPLEMYNELYEKASENNLDFIKADFYRFTSLTDGSLDKVYISLSPNQNDYNKVFNPSETPAAIKYVMNTWSGIYKREFLEKYHIRHNETPGASYQDNGFWIQTFIFGKRAMIVDKPYYMNRRDNPNSSVFDPKKVYTMNIEYDHIRDIFMEHPDLWEKFKGMYWYKKYYSYDASIKRIAIEHKRQYIERMSKEFKRGFAKNEIDLSVFSNKAQRDIQTLLNNPEEFYCNYIDNKAGSSNNASQKLKTLLKKERQIIIAIPKKIKKLIKR